MGYSRMVAGDFSSAVKICKKCIQVSPDPMISHAAKTMLGMNYLVTGQLREAQSTVDEVIDYSEKYGFEMLGTFLRQ